MKKTDKKKRVISSAKAVQEAKHSGGDWDDRLQVKGFTGLYLNIKPSNSKSWVYRYSFGGKRMPPMGIGSYPDVSLKAARELGREKAELVAKGIDPKEDKKRVDAEVAAKEAEGITFMQVAEDWMTFQIESKEWKSVDTIDRARKYMEYYCYPLIGNVAIIDIKYAHVLKILSQKTEKGRPHLWNDSNDTGTRLRRYIYQIIDRGLSKLNKQKAVFNVATFKNNLDKDLGKPKNLHTVKNHPSVPVDKLPEFISKLIEFQSLAPKGGRPDVDCFIFGMLACTRNKCTRLADWEDIDLKKKLWIVPPEKVGKQTTKTWQIPLHPRAIKIIKAQPSARKMKGRIFSTLKNGKINDPSLSKIPKLIGIKADDGRLPDFHGMRKTMNSWAKKARWDKDTRELMMQHLEESSTHAAYDNEQMIDDRREIVNGYEEYAFSMVTSNKVVPLKQRVS